MGNVKKNLVYVISLLMFAMLFTSCADVSPHAAECITSGSSGFWSGLWHGIIAPFSWFGSLFNDSVAIYDYDNNGIWYNLGFILGTSSMIVTTTTEVKTKKKVKHNRFS